MTKKRIFAVIVSSALGAAVSQQVCAQSLPGGLNLGNAAAGGQLQITGLAPQACIISAPSENGLANATLSAGATSAKIVVTKLVDPATAVPLAATVNMAFPVVCNSAHRMTVETRDGGLILQQAAPPPGPGFRNRLGYRVTAMWAGQQAQGSTDSRVPVEIDTSNGAAGELLLTIQIPAGGEPLVAGMYSDSIVLNLQPAS